MHQLKNHVGEGDHRQGKRGENLMTSRGEQPRSSILNKEQHHAGQRDDAENERNQPASAVSNILHIPLFSAARKEFIRVRASLPLCESAFAAAGVAAAPRNGSFRIQTGRIHESVTIALSNISLRGTRVSALVAVFAANAAATATA